MPRQVILGCTLSVLLLESLSVGEFRAFTYLWNNPPGSMSEARRLRRVIDYLQSRGVADVFSMNGLLEWQLMFYSDERVLARYPAASDRYPAYVTEVDRALETGKPVGVVGYTGTSGAPGCNHVLSCTGDIERLVSDGKNIFIVDGKYFVYAGADRALIQRLQFQFPAP